MTGKILFVDDDINILSAFKRRFHQVFPIETAQSGQAALDLLAASGPFAVVIADLRMPGMDGIQFLARARETSPDTVRIMLTGHADLNTAIGAVNNGNIFRFLTKPCPTDVLLKAVESGLQQYQLITAERELLEKTLNKSVRLLTDMLSLANPAAFSRVLRIRRVVRQIVTGLKLADSWQYDLAAMLSQTGCIAMPPAIQQKANSGAPLTASERSLYASHPAIGFRLLNAIPRLEQVAQMVRDQQKPYCDFWPLMSRVESHKASLGAQILKVALDYDGLIQSGGDHASAIEKLLSMNGYYNPEVVKALGQDEIIKNSWDVRIVDTGSLEPGMILDEDVCSRDGEVLTPRMQEISQAEIERLQIISRGSGLIEPFRVLVSVQNGKPAGEPALSRTAVLKQVVEV